MFKTGYTIRRPVMADAEAIARVHVSSWQTSYPGIVPDAYLESLTVERRLDLRRQIIAAGQGVHLVATDDASGAIVGFLDAGAARDRDGAAHAELYAIYVLEQHKRAGLGRQLFQRGVDELKQAGFASMHLWAVAENHSAGRFYETMGGLICGTASEDIGGRDCPLVSYAFKL